MVETIRLSIYVHPWDIFEEGVEKVLGVLKNMGISMINVATSYHAGRYILPHNPVRKVFTAEEGVVYFDYDMKYFSNSVIKPCKSRKYPDRDVLKEVCEHSRSYGIDVCSWTVFLHNRRFALKYPNLAVVDPFGCRDENFLCPNRPEVRAYVQALSKSIVGPYGVRAIQIESAAYPSGIVHGNHHETFGIRIDPLLSYLFSMCYCDYCKTKALEHNIDLDNKLPLIRKIIEDKVNTDQQGESLEGETLLSELQAQGLDKIQDFKEHCVEELYSSVSDGIKEVDPNVSVEAIVNPETLLNEGLSYGRMPSSMNGIDLITYYPDVQEIVKKVKEAKAGIKGKTLLYPCIRITYPVISSDRQLVEVVRTLKELDLAGINFYNYGWATTSCLKALQDALGSFT